MGGFLLMLCYVMLMLMFWSDAAGATDHRTAWNLVVLLFGSVPGWCISGFVRLGPKSAYADMLTCRAYSLF